MKRIKRCWAILLAVMWFSGSAYAGNTAGVFQLPFDFNQQWRDCSAVGYKFPADQIFMNFLTDKNKYHLAEDWNGVCGGSTDFGAPLFASADGIVQDIDDKSTCSDGIGKILIIRYTLPDGTYRDHAYDHVASILMRLGERVAKGQQVATLGDGNGCYPDAAHLHEEMRRQNSGLTRGQNPYYNPLLVSTALKYTSPSLFIDDRRYPFTQALANGAWTYTAWYYNAPSSTAFVEYNGERYSLARAVQAGYIYKYVYEWRNGRWYYYPDIAEVFFGAGNTYAVWSFVNGAALNILVPGNNYKDDRAKIDMIRAASLNGNFKSVKPDDYVQYYSDQSYDYHYMKFIYNNGSGNQNVYVYHATFKSNPLVRYTNYLDPITGNWNGWTRINSNTLD